MLRRYVTNRTYFFFQTKIFMGVLSQRISFNLQCLQSIGSQTCSSYLIWTSARVAAVIAPLLGTVRTAPLYVASFAELVFKSGATVSQIFFLGFKTESGRRTYPSTSTVSPGAAPAGARRIST